MQLEAAEVRTAHKRLGHELGEQPEVGPRDCRCSLAREAAAEHRESLEHVALLVREQSPGLVEGGPEATVPLGHVAHRRLEEADAPLDLVRDLRAGEHGDPRRSELDPERHPVDEPADAGCVRAVVLSELEAGIDLPRPLDEEPKRAIAPPIAVRGHAEAFDVEDPLALDTEALARCRQELDLRCSLYNLGQEPGAVHEVLEVVEDEECRALAQVVEKLLLGGEAAVRPVDRELKRVGDSRCKEVGRHNGSERDEVDAVRVPVEPTGGGLEREARLADSARPDQGEQPAVGVFEHALDRLELLGSSDEGRTRSGQIPHARLERLQQRELRGQALDLELEDPLRCAQILEAVGAEVPNVGIDERPRRLREENLPTVADRRDARALVDVEPDVTLLGQSRLACVQPHSYLDGAAREGALAVAGSGDGVRGPRERNEEGVALGIDLDAVAFGDGRAKQPAVLVKCLRIVVTELVQELRRALDVGEEERDHTGREIARHGHG